MAVGTIDSRPYIDIVFKDSDEAVIKFLDFCQNFFYHDFDMPRVTAEAKMTEHIASVQGTAFQMSSGDYAAAIYPCMDTKKCKKESLN